MQTPEQLAKAIADPATSGDAAHIHTGHGWSAMISDSELQLLELYLDDALATDEVDALDQRLRREPRILSALDQLRAQRVARSAVWRALENSGAPVSTPRFRR
jgi:hypothetical protein